MPGTLDETALPILNGAAMAAADPTPYQELIAAITANGSIRVENVRLPDPQVAPEDLVRVVR